MNNLTKILLSAIAVLGTVHAVNYDSTQQDSYKQNTQTRSQETDRYPTTTQNKNTTIQSNTQSKGSSSFNGENQKPLIQRTQKPDVPRISIKKDRIQERAQPIEPTEIATPYEDTKNLKVDPKNSLDRYLNDIDRKINQKIRDQITGWFSNNYKEISLKTSDGIVTIDGYVSNNEDLNKLLSAVRKTDGVKSFKNNAQIK